MKLAVFFTFIISLQDANAKPAQKNLLSEKDLQKGGPFISAKEAERTKGPGYFWVCKEKSRQSLLAQCDNLGRHETEGPKAELRLEIKSGDFLHSYGLRHAIPAKECHSYLKEIHQIQRAGVPFCVYGALARVDTEQKKIGWVFFEMKTKTQRVVDFDYEPSE